MDNWETRIAELRQERSTLDFLIKDAHLSGRWSTEENLIKKYQETHEEYNQLLKIEHQFNTNEIRKLD